MRSTPRGADRLSVVWRRIDRADCCSCVIVPGMACLSGAEKQRVKTNRYSKFAWLMLALGAAGGGADVSARAADERAPSEGPDVTVGELRGDQDLPTSQPRSFGTAGGYAGYAAGTTSCNVGNQPLQWMTFGSPTPTLHPVIHQSLYRYSEVNGASRIEMIGQSWLKHGFCALQDVVCGSCTPYCGGCCDHLGPGCSDPYTASRNGNRNNLGPKSQINAATGEIMVWPYPLAPTTDATTGRLRALISDVDPLQNPGAAYFVEGSYIARDDTAAGNNRNNSSYRRCVFNSGGLYAMSWFSVDAFQTVRQKAAIYAWQDLDPGVVIQHMDVPKDGRFTIGHRVTDTSGNGAGPWHYEYAILNMNSHRSASAVSVQLGADVEVTNTGFHDVEYHSGDGYTIGTNYDGTDWPATVTPGDSVSWEMTPATPWENSNALRWGTTYNFRFDADSPPTAGDLKITFYRSGTPADLPVVVQVPQGPCACPGDLNGDGLLDGRDVAEMVRMLIGQAPPSRCAQVAKPTSWPIDEDDVTEFVDLLLNGAECR
jgi:hypothetical protein